MYIGLRDMIIFGTYENFINWLSASLSAKVSSKFKTFYFCDALPLSKNKDK